VVLVQTRNEQDVLGNYFLVESDKKSPEQLVVVINEFLVEAREAVKNVTEE